MYVALVKTGQTTDPVADHGAAPAPVDLVESYAPKAIARGKKELIKLQDQLVKTTKVIGQLDRENPLSADYDGDLPMPDHEISDRLLRERRQLKQKLEDTANNIRKIKKDLSDMRACVFREKEYPGRPPQALALRLLRRSIFSHFRNLVEQRRDDVVACAIANGGGKEKRINAASLQRRTEKLLLQARCQLKASERRVSSLEKKVKQDSTRRGSRLESIRENGKRAAAAEASAKASAAAALGDTAKAAANVKRARKDRDAAEAAAASLQ